MSLNFETRKFLKFFCKILLFSFIGNIVATEKRYEITFKYYVDNTNSAQMYDGDLFWAEVNESDLNGIFLLKVEKGADVTPAADSSSALDMVLTVPDRDFIDIEGQEYHVERPIATLKCYFIAKPDDVKDLNPLLDHFDTYYKGGILRQLDEYAHINDNKYFYHMDFDLSIIALVDSNDEHLVLRDGADSFLDPTTHDTSVPNWHSIFDVVLRSRNYNESNFFTIKSEGISVTPANHADADGNTVVKADDANDSTLRTNTKELKIEFAADGVAGYTLYTPSTDANGGIAMTKIETTADGVDIENKIREVLRLI